MSWMHASLTSFVRGPVIHTPEGLLFAVGSIASWLVAASAWWWPSLIGLRPELSSGSAALFGMWPVCLLAIYVKFCGPHFRPSLFTSLIMFAAAAFPFYLAYK